MSNLSKSNPLFLQTSPWAEPSSGFLVSRKSDKQWKVLRDFLENWPTGGPSGNHTDYPWDLPRTNISRQPLRTFHCLYQSGQWYSCTVVQLDAVFVKIARVDRCRVVERVLQLGAVLVKIIRVDSFKVGCSDSE